MVQGESRSQIAEPWARWHDKAQLRILDACLSQLEDANERDELVVSGELAMRLKVHVPAISAGMSVSDAIEVVLGQQERYLRPSGAKARGRASGIVSLPAGPAVDLGREPLSRTAALELTVRIRAASRHNCLLLLEAHERRAWSALGYRTWERYARAEFGLGRRRSYELLDQAHVILAIQAAAGTAAAPDISAYRALQIRPRLDSVTAAIRARTAGLPAAEVGDVVGAVIGEVQASWRRRGQRTREGAVPLEPDGCSAAIAERERLFDAVDSLSRMPPALEVVATIPTHEWGRLASLDRAVHWLAEFEWRWRNYRTARARRPGVLVAPGVDVRNSAHDATPEPALQASRAGGA